MELLGGILLAVGLSVVIMFFQNKKRKQAWTGQVIKIKEMPAGFVDTESEYASANDLKEYVKIYYTMENGAGGKIRLEKKQCHTMYPQLRVGSRLRKTAGQEYPEIVDNEG